jgi:hypothetical protein
MKQTALDDFIEADIENSSDSLVESLKTCVQMDIKRLQDELGNEATKEWFDNLFSL